MKRLRLASWAALAGLVALSGCQSSWTCGNRLGIGQGQLLQRLCRPRCTDVVSEGPVVGTPVSSMPISSLPVTSELPYCPESNACPYPVEGGPVLPPTESYPGGAINGSPYLNIPGHGTPFNSAPIQGAPPTFSGETAPPPMVPGVNNARPPSTLPPPMPVPGNARPPLTPVPGNGGLAPPTVAPPASRKGS